MGRLSGFTYREVTRKLKKVGFEFYRTGKGDHEIWFNPHNHLKTTIPHHKKIKEGTLRNILKQCQIEVDDFLDLQRKHLIKLRSMNNANRPTFSTS